MYLRKIVSLANHYDTEICVSVFQVKRKTHKQTNQSKKQKQTKTNNKINLKKNMKTMKTEVLLSLNYVNKTKDNTH